MQHVGEQARSGSRRRQRNRERMRQRIVDATIELHQTLGPARTTISEIARRARVQRLTVYRYFPDQLGLLKACSSRYQLHNPPPDPERWAAVADPRERLGLALREVLPFYRRTSAMASRVLRDLSLDPLLSETLKPRLRWSARLRQILEQGWRVRGRRLRLLRAAIGHAVDYRTWESLAGAKLDDVEIAELLIAMVREVAQPCDLRSPRPPPVGRTLRYVGHRNGRAKPDKKP